ncbi:MAG: alpha/beta hydrolase [Candidatus Bathyarchaeota archaeon]|nr:alpha/beta hydrolase [Candidatus Bathyarchaeota archaeon]
MSSQVISLPDGRQLGYSIIGEGRPVLYFHGTASSRLEVLLLKDLAEKGKLQIICIDRPGYGLSTYKPRKNLQDFNDDVNFLTEHLGIERFGVLGWSGGGAFALAYLAFFPERVTKAVIVGAPALPFDASTAHNMPFARYIMKMPFLGHFAMKRMSHEVLKANGDVAAFLKSKQGKQMLHACSKDDLKFFSDPSWMALMYQSIAEAFHQRNSGVKAVVDEHQRFLKPWGLPFERVSSGKLVIWHGAEDKTCRVNNAYDLLCSVPCGVLKIFPEKGHCVMFDNLQQLSEILK